MLLGQRLVLDRLEVNIDEPDQITDQTLEKVVALTADFQRYMSFAKCPRITSAAFDNLAQCIHLRERKLQMCHRFISPSISTFDMYN